MGTIIQMSNLFDNNIAEFRHKIYLDCLKELDAKNFKYMLTRDHAHFGDVDDVDVIVLKKDIDQIIKVLTPFLSKLVSPIYSIKFVDEPGHILLVYVVSKNVCLKFDLIWEIRWKGIVLVDDRCLLFRKVSLQKICVPTISFEMYLLVVKEIIMHKTMRLKTKYLKTIEHLVSCDPTHAFDEISRVLGHECENIVKTLFNKLKEESSEELLQARREIIIYSLRSLIMRKNFAVVLQICNFRYWAKLISSKFKKKGIFIAIYGPDGSGKSTVVGNLYETLRRMRIFSDTKIFHFKPVTLLKYHLLIKDTTHVMGGRPYVARPRSPLMSSIKLLYNFFEYNIGYLLYIRPLLLHSCAVLFDRYFLDFYFDPERCRINLKPNIIKLLYKFIPKPTINIFLTGDPQTFVERKRELTIAEVSKLIRKYEMEGRKQGIVLDSSRMNVDDIVNEIIKVIIKSKSFYYKL